MTKAGVMNFFGVVRAFALALAATGLVLICGSVITHLLAPTPLGAMPWTLMPGALGVIAVSVGVLLALPGLAAAALLLWRYYATAGKLPAGAE